MNSNEFKARVTAWRHELHRNPEAAFIAERLSEMGIKVTTGIGKTGVVGSLTCGDGEGSIAIRSDMDSLKIDEKSGHDHVSENPGNVKVRGDTRCYYPEDQKLVEERMRSIAEAVS